MEFKPFTKKLVAILSKKIETGRAMNALAHMSLGLGASTLDKSSLRFQDYTDLDGGTHPQISDIPFIILRAKPSQIKKLRKQAIDLGIQYTDFTHTMIGQTYIEQHQNTQQTSEEDIEYFGLCLFGDKEQLTQMTRKLSLWT